MNDTAAAPITVAICGGIVCAAALVLAHLAGASAQDLMLWTMVAVPAALGAWLFAWCMWGMLGAARQWARRRRRRSRIGRAA